MTHALFNCDEVIVTTQGLNNMKQFGRIPPIFAIHTRTQRHHLCIDWLVFRDFNYASVMVSTDAMLIG